MTKVIIRHRLVTWFEEFEDKFAPNGLNHREHLSHMGTEVDIPDEEVERINGVNDPENPPFYSDADAEKIRNGSYRGSDADTLSRFRAGAVAGPKVVEDLDGEGAQTADLDAADLAEYIKENNLTVPETIALAGDDLASIEKVLDAENIASDNDPRTGVVKGLEAKMRAATA